MDVIDCATIVHEMKKLNASPFILKIDIEGSEEDVFSGDSSWLDPHSPDDTLISGRLSTIKV